MNELGWRILIGVLCFFAGAIVYILNDQFHEIEKKHKIKVNREEAYMQRVDMHEDEVCGLRNAVDMLEEEVNSLSARVNGLEKRNSFSEHREPIKYEWKSVQPASNIERHFYYGAKHAKAD